MKLIPRSIVKQGPVKVDAIEQLQTCAYADMEMVVSMAGAGRGYVVRYAPVVSMPVASPPAGGAAGRTSAIALVVALVAGTLLVILPPGTSVVPAATPTPTALTDVWPNATVVGYAGRLDDGTQFRPRLQIDSGSAVGTAPTSDGTATRILVRTATTVTEIHRVSRDLFPELAGFTTSGDTVVWAETTYPPGIVALTQLWRTNWRKPEPAVLITADAGRAVFFQTQYDIEIVDGFVYWVCSEYATVPLTQVRSVALTGGVVGVTELLGTYALSRWPWLVTPYGGRTDPARLMNLETGQQVTVAHTHGELTRCSSTWCRVGITGAKTLIRIDLVKPDGSGRRRIAGGDATPVLNDVALLDRFEALIIDGTGPGVSRGLCLYDIVTGRTVTLATDVVNAASHGGMLWWATGGEGNSTWTALDLRTLTP